mgnify:FL=1
MRLLLTNDDGVHSPGIHAIATALHDEGHDVTVVAPDSEHSGWSAGVGTLVEGAEIDVHDYTIDGAHHIPAWAVSGPPALCVLVAMLETFGPRPDLVISGINDGTNAGRGVLQSGTVGGAMIAQTFGVSGLAVSQKVTDEPMQWETGAAVTVAAVDWLVAAPRKTVINVNVPNRPLADLAGVRWARLAAFGTTSTGLQGSVPGTLKVRVTNRDVQLKPDTDTHLIDEGYVTVTGLLGYRAEADDSGPAADAISQALGRRGLRISP